MAARQNQNQLVSLARMGNLADSPLYWTDNQTQGAKAINIIASLPLKLPAGETYGLSIRGDVLVIAGSRSGITGFKIDGSPFVRGIEGVDEGTLISVEAGNGIRKILLLSQPKPIPRNALNHSSVTAPVSLLDEYAKLRIKEESQELSLVEHNRKKELLDEIGLEYRRLNQQVQSSPYHSTSAAESYRSTPASTGESRCGSTNGRGG
jgi:hypothetical protein